MGLFSISPEKLGVYEKIANELREAGEDAGKHERIAKGAVTYLPSYESDLMYALFTDFEEQVFTEKLSMKARFSHLWTDMNRCGYEGRSREDYEAERKRAVKDILAEKDGFAAVRKFYQAAPPLREAARGVAYNELAGWAASLVYCIEVCARLLRNGKLSLTEITDCLPGRAMCDVYGLAQMLNIPVQATDGELARIREEEESAKGPKASEVLENAIREGEDE